MSDDLPADVADAVRKRARLHPEDSPVTILGALRVDPVHLEAVRTIVEREGDRVDEEGTGFRKSPNAHARAEEKRPHQGELEVDS